jgi:hypothetical protein
MDGRGGRALGEGEKLAGSSSAGRSSRRWPRAPAQPPRHPRRSPPRAGRARRDSRMPPASTRPGTRTSTTRTAWRCRSTVPSSRSTSSSVRAAPPGEGARAPRPSAWPQWAPAARRGGRAGRRVLDGYGPRRDGGHARRTAPPPVTMGGFALDAREVSRACLAAFLAAGGYDELHHWTAGGSPWRSRLDVRGPPSGTCPASALPTCPSSGCRGSRRRPTAAGAAAGSRQGPSGRRRPAVPTAAGVPVSRRERRAGEWRRVRRPPDPGGRLSARRQPRRRPRHGRQRLGTGATLGRRALLESPPSDPPGPLTGESSLIRGAAPSSLTR